MKANRSIMDSCLRQIRLTSQRGVTGTTRSTIDRPDDRLTKFEVVPSPRPRNRRTLWLGSIALPGPAIAYDSEIRCRSSPFRAPSPGAPHGRNKREEKVGSSLRVHLGQKYARYLKVQFGDRGSREGRGFGLPEPDSSSLAFYAPLTVLLVRRECCETSGMYDLDSCQHLESEWKKSSTVVACPP
jgi:hypothetical protein